MSARPMHVALVTPAYPPLPGGGERYVGALARGLVASGLRVTVVTGAATAESDFWNGTDGRSDTVEDGVRVIRLPVSPAAGGRPGLMRRRKWMVLVSALPGDQSSYLSGLARQFPAIEGIDEALDSLEAVDLVHGFNISWEHALVAAHAYSRRAAVPLAITPFAHLGESSLGRVARNSTMNHQLRILRQADKVLVLTRIESDGLARYHVRPERLDVMGSGADPIPDDFTDSPYFADDHHEARGNFGVYIGRQSFDKGALHAADAVRMLRRRGRDIALLLVGSSTPEFEKYRRRLSPEDQAAIRPLGIISDRDKHAVLSRAKFLMLPSRSDSFGIVLLEAWAHGVPVIAARAGGIPGVVGDGANGLLVPFADVDGLANAAERLITDEVFARRIGEAGREKVRSHYCWDVVVARVCDQYRALVDAS
ncbi:MAG: glycosyltransferase family 4 protein [Candidatus Promineofilum sp.]|nr:glycosyltransferase family 4 protein [Promineifilum sp.]